MPRKLILSLAVLATVASSGASADMGALKIGAATDLVGTVGTHPSGAEGRIDVREVELLFDAAVDPYFHGILSAAVHYEDGEQVFELHEAAMTSATLIPRLNLQLGKFFPTWGRLHEVHRHDWPFITAPKVHREFFGSEGITDTGLEVGWLLPFSFPVELTGGVLSGWKWDHEDTTHAKPVVPTHYVRLSSFADIGNDRIGDAGLQVGSTYMGRTDSANLRTQHIGADITAKFGGVRHTVFLIQTEGWYRYQLAGDSTETKNWGVYLYPQYGLSERWYIGLRGEYFSDVGASRNTFGLVPTLTFKPSEFSTLRLAYTYESAQSGGVNTGQTHGAELQAVFVIGAHPAHKF